MCNRYSLRHPDTKGTYTGETHISTHPGIQRIKHTNENGNTVSCAMPSMHSRQFAAKSISPAVGMPSVQLLEQLLPARPSPVSTHRQHASTLHYDLKSGRSSAGSIRHTQQQRLEQSSPDGRRALVAAESERRAGRRAGRPATLRPVPSPQM